MPAQQPPAGSPMRKPFHTHRIQIQGHPARGRREPPRRRVRATVPGQLGVRRSREWLLDDRHLLAAAAANKRLLGAGLVPHPAAHPDAHPAALVRLLRRGQHLHAGAARARPLPGRVRPGRRGAVHRGAAAALQPLPHGRSLAPTSACRPWPAPSRSPHGPAHRPSTSSPAASSSA